MRARRLASSSVGSSRVTRAYSSDASLWRFAVGQDRRQGSMRLGPRRIERDRRAAPTPRPACSHAAVARRPVEAELRQRSAGARRGGARLGAARGLEVVERRAAVVATRPRAGVRGPAGRSAACRRRARRGRGRPARRASQPSSSSAAPYIRRGTGTVPPRAVDRARRELPAARRVDQVETQRDRRRPLLDRRHQRQVDAQDLARVGGRGDLALDDVRERRRIWKCGCVVRRRSRVPSRSNAPSANDAKSRSPVVRGASTATFMSRGSAGGASVRHSALPPTTTAIAEQRRRRQRPFRARARRGLGPDGQSPRASRAPPGSGRRGGAGVAAHLGQRALELDGVANRALGSLASILATTRDSSGPAAGFSADDRRRLASQHLVDDRGVVGALERRAAPVSSS